VKINAYIDGANLHKALDELGWKLDYGRFRKWLQDKYDLQYAYLFIGLVPKNKDLYTKLQEQGFTLVYKEVTYDGKGKIKGNCDSELVLKVAVDFYEKHFDRAVLVSSDGDYSCLVSFLNEKKSFHTLISPGNKCSFLLRKLNIPIVYLDSQRVRLDTEKTKNKHTKKKKPPMRTEPHKGLLHGDTRSIR